MVIAIIFLDNYYVLSDPWTQNERILGHLDPIA